MAYERTVKSRGHKYRQLVESRWDPVKKQPRTHVIKHLGKVVEEDGKTKVVPAGLKVDSIQSAFPVGKLALFWNIIQEFGIQQALQESLGDETLANAIIILVLNQLSGRKALTKIEDWVTESPLPRWMGINPKNLTRDRLLNALDSVVSKRDGKIVSNVIEIQSKCADQWLGKVEKPSQKSFYYQDVTRIKYHGKRCEWAEPGHGPERGKTYIGSGLIISRDCRMPLRGITIRGSNTDMTTVEEFVDTLSIKEHPEIILVWDRGFVKKANVQIARGKGYHVLAPGVLTSNAVKEELVRYTDAELERRSQLVQLPSGRGVYCKDRIGKLYGERCRIVVMFDPERRNRERLARDRLLQELEASKDKEIIAQLKKELSPVVVPAPGRRGYLIDDDAEKLARKSDGRIVFFCTDLSISASEILQTYYLKDQIEKAFRLLRNSGWLSPIQYQNRERVEAYLTVVCFLAYEVIAGVLWKLLESNLKFGFKELVYKLRKLHEVELVSRKKTIFRWTHLTKKEEKLFAPFGITGLKPSH